MNLPPALRTLLLLVTGGLAACAGGPGTAAATAEASVMLISRTSPTLALMSDGLPAPAAPNGNALVPKVVDPAGMAALIATFESQQMFRYALAEAPTGARQALVLDREGRRSVWVFVDGGQDQRYAAFVQARNYFLQLFNHARNYAPDEQAKQDMRESRELERQRERQRRRQ